LQELARWMNKQDLASDLVRSCKIMQDDFKTKILKARSACKYLQDQWLARLSKIKQD
jgi:hypothetical protein